MFRWSSLVLSLLVLCTAPSLADTFSTYAGSGLPGVNDGPAAQARFLFPYGVAVAPDGSIFVSDFQGQRIRRIDRNHHVTTVAGGGAVDAEGLRVAGDYRDGVGPRARFNFPAGIAFDKTGRLFIADAGNGCIRVLENGIVPYVRTYAGLPGRDARDGTLATAGFSEPRALAFDAAGNLWVGDFRYGIRKIAPDGTVTTLKLPGDLGRFTSSITPVPDGLLIVDNNQLVEIDGISGPPAQYTISHPTEDSRAVNVAQGDVSEGFPFAVASMTDGTYLMTDPREQAIRLFNESNFIEDIGVSPNQEYAVYGGGYRNGPNGLVDTPLGIAALDPHTVVFADAGNRRIRMISNIETRHWAKHQIAPFGADGDATKFYRILIVGDCYVGWGVPFQSTIAGDLERALNANRKELGIARPVRVAQVFSGRASDVRDYMRDVASAGVADLVVWEFNDAMPNQEWTPGRGTLTDPLEDRATWEASLGPKIAQIGSYFKKAGVPYYALVHPTPLYFPLLEDYDVRQVYVPPLWSQVEPIYARLFQGTVDGYIDAGPAMMADERSADRQRLFLSDGEYQLSAAGDALLAKLLYQRFAADKPWTHE